MSDGFIDLRQNHAHLVEESFWPSFTDIMMVIVMVFLLVTVSVILNNWTLISDLKKSISAQEVATSLAKSEHQENQNLSTKLNALSQQFDSVKDEKNANAEISYWLEDTWMRVETWGDIAIKVEHYDRNTERNSQDSYRLKRDENVTVKDLKIKIW